MKKICHNCGKEFTLQPNQTEKSLFCSPFCCSFYWEKRQGVGNVSGHEIFPDGTIVKNGRVQS